MHKNILVIYDGSGKSKITLDRALSTAKGNDGSITMAWIRGPLPSNPLSVGEVDEDIESSEIFFRKLCVYTEQQAVLQKVPIKCVNLKGDTAKVIVKYAKENGIDLIVVGQATYPARLLNNVLKTVPEKLKKLSPCEVLVV